MSDSRRYAMCWWCSARIDRHALNLPPEVPAIACERAECKAEEAAYKASLVPKGSAAA